jgi:hypothetical protein
MLYIGDSKLSSVGASTSVPLSPSSNETVWVEVLRATLREGPTSGVPMLERTIKAPVQVEVAGANTIPHVDGGRVNEVEPRPEDMPGKAILILGSPRRPGSRPPRRTTLDDTASIPGSFDNVFLEAGELGLSGYPRAPPPPANWR